MTTGRKLVIGGVIVAGVTAFMAYRGASATWQYYLTADECVAGKASLVGRRVRASGRVAANSLVVEKNRRQATFMLEGDKSQLKVVCAGPLPDNLAQGMAVLVEGRMDNAGVFQGDKMMTRCASKYESRLPANRPLSFRERARVRAVDVGTRDAAANLSSPRAEDRS